MSLDSEMFRLQLHPVIGHKKWLSSVYRDYLFCSPEFNPKENEDFDYIDLGHRCELPALPQETFAVHLSFSQGPHPYVISLLDGHYFGLNGNQVREAQIKFGDTLMIGHNVLKLLPPQPTHHRFEEEEISSERSELAEAFWSSSLYLLIEGETGVGKTQLAKQIYEWKGRGKKWCHLNLASFAPSLLESELFGHVKGAFTGAVQDKRGALEEAQGGVLFLDEIDSLSLEMQAKHFTI